MRPNRLTPAVSVIVLFLASTGFPADFYRVPNGDTVDINEHGVCARIRNISGQDKFVPTRTAKEWQNFRDRLPNGVWKLLCCPDGYISVPGNPEYGTTDFCVAKYEMKNVNGVAKSQAANIPWVNISREQARSSCSSLGSHYRLIRNAEWQTIARNIELVAANWSGGAVGSGTLNRGHSDSEPNNPIPASSDDSQACYGTNQSCSKLQESSQKRTHVLSNGEVIWDFSGNVYEWISDNLSALNLSPPLSSDWHEFNSLSEVNRKIFGPSSPVWSSSNGIGRIYGGAGDSFARGGSWRDGVSAGIFAAKLNAGPLDAYTNVGFRCVWKP